MKQSAGILLYRLTGNELTVLLVHPGGPFFAKKDNGAWTIPKGELAEEEEPLLTAKREFEEETGKPVTGVFIKLTSIKQKGGKLVHAWAVEGDFDTSQLKSNMFEMSWPPRSGLIKRFPEIDKAQWFTPEEALDKLLPAQRAFITELQTVLQE